MTSPAGGSRTLTAPPPPTGDPQLLRAYASSLRELATTLRRMAGTVSTPLPGTWRGDAPVAAAATAARLAAEFRLAAAAVDDIAAHLDTYAGKLSAATEHHHHWLKLVAEVAGVVLVTAAVVTITVATAGAAGPVAAGLAIAAEEGAAGAAAGAAGGAAAAGAAGGAAAAGAESTAAAAVAGMETAAASASSAETSLLGSLGARLPLLRQLSTFVRPQLVAAEVSTGFDAAVRVADGKGIRPLSIAVDLTENIVIGAGVGAAAGRWLSKPGIAAWIGRRISPSATELHGRAVLVRHLTNASTNAGMGAAEDELTGHRPTKTSLGLDFLEGSIGSEVGDVAAVHDVKVARGVNAVKNSRIPALRVDLEGKVVRGIVGRVYRVDPTIVKFTQNSVTKADLRVVSLAGGWERSKDPLTVMVMPDGSLTSLDNRRVVAARQQGVQILVKLTDPNARVPADLLATRFSKYRLAPGSTWREVFQARINDQKGWRVNHPHGRLQLPDKIKPGPQTIQGIRPPRAVTRVE